MASVLSMLVALAVVGGMGCGGNEARSAGERAAGPVRTTALEVMAPPGGPSTRMPRPMAIVDVTQVQRQPDGTLRTYCGRPTDDGRRAMEVARRRAQP